MSNLDFRPDLRIAERPPDPWELAVQIGLADLDAAKEKAAKTPKPPKPSSQKGNWRLTSAFVGFTLLLSMVLWGLQVSTNHETRRIEKRAQAVALHQCVSSNEHARYAAEAYLLAARSYRTQGQIRQARRIVQSADSLLKGQLDCRRLSGDEP